MSTDTNPRHVQSEAMALRTDRSAQLGDIQNATLGHLIDVLFDPQDAEGVPFARRALLCLARDLECIESAVSAGNSVVDWALLQSLSFKAEIAAELDRRFEESRRILAGGEPDPVEDGDDEPDDDEPEAGTVPQ